MKNENTDLFELCRSGDIIGIEKFLKNGGNIFRKTESGATALHISCMYKHHELVKFLITKGFIINSMDRYKETCLFYSLQSEDILETLLKNGANLNHCNNDGDIFLHLASRLGYIDSVKFLINNGADYLENHKGETPLHSAIERGNLNVVEYFINIGCFHSPKTKADSTPLHYASLNNEYDIVKFLVSQGANPNYKSRDFLSSWDYVKIEKKKFFRVFIEYGHMPDIKSFYDDELKELFMKFFKIPEIYLLFCAREKNVDSYFYKDYLPFDLFKEIFKITRSICLKHKWDTFLKKCN